MAKKTVLKWWVIGTNDPNKFQEMIDAFCTGKKVLEKHFSCSTQLVPAQSQVPQGVLSQHQAQQFAVQPYTVLHCMICYQEEVQLPKDVN